MDKLTLGATSIQVSRLAYGCWRILGSEGSGPGSNREAGARAAITAAYEAGFTFFDHADVYADGASEKVFGEVLNVTNEAFRVHYQESEGRFRQFEEYGLSANFGLRWKL